MCYVLKPMWARVCDDESRGCTVRWLLHTCCVSSSANRRGNGLHSSSHGLQEWFAACPGRSRSDGPSAAWWRIQNAQDIWITIAYSTDMACVLCDQLSRICPGFLEGSHKDSGHLAEFCSGNHPKHHWSLGLTLEMWILGRCYIYSSSELLHAR